MQGESGLMSVTGADQNNLARVGNSTVDIYAGYICVISILAHILQIQRTREKNQLEWIYRL